MGLRTKFNLAVMAAFIVGLAATTVLMKRSFEDSARTEAIQRARAMMAAANAVRHYTTTVIEPLIGTERDGVFLRASVPSFAAQTNLRDLGPDFKEFRYKEATLNPTNLTDRASDWEADIVNTFRHAPDETEMITDRETPTGTFLNVARPIAVKDPACLICHSTPAVAPASMKAQYGTANGFGWKMDEVIGAQIMSLPLAGLMARAHQGLGAFMALMAGVFVVMLVMINVLLHVLVIRPVNAMSRVATEVSLGNMSAPPFDAAGKDEISLLSAAFNRMRRSLASALRMLEDESGKEDGSRAA